MKKLVFLLILAFPVTAYSGEWENLIVCSIATQAQTHTALIAPVADIEIEPVSIDIEPVSTETTQVICENGSCRRVIVSKTVTAVRDTRTYFQIFRRRPLRRFFGWCLLRR